VGHVKARAANAKIKCRIKTISARLTPQDVEIIRFYSSFSLQWGRFKTNEGFKLGFGVSAIFARRTKANKGEGRRMQPNGPWGGKDESRLPKASIFLNFLYKKK